MSLVSLFLNIALLGSEWVLWLLVILSVLSISIIIERAVYFSKITIKFDSFTKFILEAIQENRLDEAEKHCLVTPALEAKVVLAGIQHVNQGKDIMEQQMLATLIAAKRNLERGLVVLGTLGNNAPFVGLFGTVIGIIQAFHNLGTNPAGGAGVVMAGISEALVATAIGLFVAIPAVIAFNFFHRVIKVKISNAESLLKIIVSMY